MSEEVARTGSLTTFCLTALGYVRAVVGALVCGYLAVTCVVEIHDSTRTGWDAVETIGVMVQFSAPLVLVGWAVVGGPSWRACALRWSRLIIACHLAVVVGLFIWPILPFEFSVLWSVKFAIAAASIDLCLLVLGPLASSRADVLRVYRWGLLGLSSVCLSTMLIWSFVTVWWVTQQAEATADGRRYCLMVPVDAEKHYRPVAGLSDLLGLKLRAPVVRSIAGSPGYAYSRHLLLAIAPAGAPRLNPNGEEQGLEFWHWSHRQRRFIPPEMRESSSMEGWVIEPLHKYCVPREGYVRSLW